MLDLYHAIEIVQLTLQRLLRGPSLFVSLHKHVSDLDAAHTVPHVNTK